MSILTSLTVLIIDDVEIEREILSFALESAKMKVINADNGKTGLEIFKSKKPDLIIIDLYMPVMDGYEVLESVKKISPLTPVIVISGAEEIEDAIKAIKLGAWDYLTKPVNDVDLLYHSLERVVERAQLIKQKENYEKDLEKKIKLRTLELSHINDKLIKENKIRKQAEFELQKIRDNLEIEVQKKTAQLRKAKENAESANEQLKKSISLLEHEAALGTLTSGIAHDLNNVLTEMMAYSMIEKAALNIKNILSEDQENQLIKEFKKIEISCKAIKDSVDIGQKLCQSFTSISKSVSMGRKSQFILPLINPPLGIIQRKIKNLRINVEIIHDENIPKVNCNGSEIQRILLNLFINAIQAMERVSNERNLIIELSYDNEMVYIKVTDTGEGVPLEFQSKIFDNFFTTKLSGSGIGLSTAKKIVEAHHGIITVKSKPGNGTTFTIALPI